MRLGKICRKTVAYILTITMLWSVIWNNRVVAIYEYEFVNVEFEQLLSELERTRPISSDSSRTIADSISLLTYDGEQRVFNNLLYNYTNGKLTSIVDSQGNVAEFIYDEEDNLIEIHFDGNIMEIEINEFGFISHYNVVGTEIGASYEFTESGVITTINRNDTEMKIANSDIFEPQQIFLNDFLIIENDQSATETIVASRSKAFTEGIGKLYFEFSDNDFAQTMHYGTHDDFLSVEFNFDEYYRITSINYSNDVKLVASYDEFGFSNTDLLFHNSDGETLTLSTIVEPTIVSVGELYRLDEVNFTQKSNHFRYVLNDIGVIGSIYQNDVLAYEYTYDRLTGQLLTVYDNIRGIVYLFTYDDFGNILYRTISSPYGVQTFIYEYNNPDWRDQLTAFNGRPIFYDLFGNMTNGLGMNLNWENNNLVRLEKNDIIMTFTYNADGFRDSKTVNGVTTNFVLDRHQVIAEYTSDGQSIVYMFDHEDGLIGFTLNGVQFFYLTNLFGDVIGIMNENMEVIVEYRYDAWGNILEISGPEADTIGRINPIRYRGYRFDEASGLYYIGGRYYSPVLGRFINPDNSLGIIGNSLSHNLYAYALNNPMLNVHSAATGTITKQFVFPLVFKTIAVVFVLLAMLYTLHQFTLWMNSVMNGVAQLGNLIGSAVLAQDWGSQLVQKVSEANVRYGYGIVRTPIHLHHIIARNAAPAQQARTIYHLYWPHPSEIDNPRNLIGIRASLHSRLHTTLYYNTVNAIMFAANDWRLTPNSLGASRVQGALNTMGHVLLISSNMSP